MQVRLIAAVAVWAILGHGAMAQSAADLAGPAELPPDGFPDAQYVDSTGCVFLRAGLNDQVLWVPRVTKDRKPLCGYAPSLVVADPVVEQPVDVVAPQSEPARTVAVEPPQAVATPKKARRKAAKAQRHALPRCADEAPLLARVSLASGGTAVLCLSEDARLVPRSTVMRFDAAIPLGIEQAAGAVLVCPRGAGSVQRVPLTAGGATLLCTAGDGGLSGLAVPRLRDAAAAPAAPGRFVQVASFVQPDNAARTKAWLARLGLPVATGRLTRRGVDFEVVFAGPIPGNEQAAATLDLVRAAGFDDAFLR